MAVCYVASVQVPHAEGFWMPYESWEYHEFPADTMAEAMLWMANNPDAYDENAETAIALRVDGKTLVIWELSRKETVTCDGRRSW